MTGVGFGSGQRNFECKPVKIGKKKKVVLEEKKKLEKGVMCCSGRRFTWNSNLRKWLRI